MGMLNALPAASRIHGGLMEEELNALGINPSEVVDFSVNTNPYGPCPAVVEAVRNAPVERYPDPTAALARRAIARMHNRPPEEVVLGNGSCDLLWSLARVLVGPTTTVAVVEPTFAEFRAACEAAGGQVVEWRAEAQNSFAVDMSAVQDLVQRYGASILYICSPNTPTGAQVRALEVKKLAHAHPHTTVILDQAFISLSDHSEDGDIKLPANVICVRSFTKDHSIPGVRVGYLLASPEVASRVERVRPAWTTSAAAQSAAVAACRETEFVAKSKTRILADRDYLMAALPRLGLRPVPTSTMFFLVPVEPSEELRLRLLRRRVLVRDCSSFGLPGYIRICARPLADCSRLLSALKEELC